MALDIVNTLNGITPAMWQRPRRPRSQTKQLEDDGTGSATLAYLRKVKKVAQLSADNSYSGSFGLDHAVYCYGATGKFHPAALLASFKFAEEVDQKNKRHDFTSIRAPFEEFLVKHKEFINILGHSKGSRTRSVDSLLLMYRTTMAAILSGKTNDAAIMSELLREPDLKDWDRPRSPLETRMVRIGERSLTRRHKPPQSLPRFCCIVLVAQFAALGFPHLREAKITLRGSMTEG